MAIINEYNVAFRNTEKAGASNGIITWRTFHGIEEFTKFCDSDDGKTYLSTREIAAQGITSDQAIALCRTVPIESLLAAAHQKALDPETGLVRQDVLAHEMAKVKSVIEMDISERPL